MALATACPHGVAAAADSDAVWVEEEAWDAEWHIRMLMAQVCLMLHIHTLPHLIGHPPMDGKKVALDSQVPRTFLPLIAEGQGRDGGAWFVVPRFIKD